MYFLFRVTLFSAVQFSVVFYKRISFSKFIYDVTISSRTLPKTNYLRRSGTHHNPTPALSYANIGLPSRFVIRHPPTNPENIEYANYHLCVRTHITFKRFQWPTQTTYKIVWPRKIDSVRADITYKFRLLTLIKCCFLIKVGNS